MGNRAISDADLTLVRHVEGYDPFVYQDAAGKEIIGIGHPCEPGEKIPESLLGQAAERMLQQAIKLKAAYEMR
jgi:GH24 family phage-related lysozyme (muramidase)